MALPKLTLLDAAALVLNVLRLLIEGAIKQGNKCGVDPDMPKLTKKTTICVEPEMLEYLRAKSAEESRSISDIINEALSMLFAEDIEDITGFDVRIGA